MSRPYGPFPIPTIADLHIIDMVMHPESHIRGLTAGLPAPTSAPLHASVAATQPDELLNYGPRRKWECHPIGGERVLPPRPPRPIYQPGEAPHDWESRRERILARQDQVKDWHTPWGFAEVFDAYHTTIPVKGSVMWQAEVDYLEATQDRDLAPSFLELRENYRQAISLQASVPGSEEGELSLEEAISADDARDALYVMPDRREQWLKEQDAYLWYCGPVRKAQLIPTPSGGVGLAPVDVRLSAQHRAAWLAEIGAELKAEGALPTAADLGDITYYHDPNCTDDGCTRPWHTRFFTGVQQELRLRKQFYGDNWRLSLLTPSELERYHQWVEIQKDLDIADQDYQRDAFVKADYADASEAICPPHCRLGDPHKHNYGYAGPTGELGVAWPDEMQGPEGPEAKDDPEPYVGESDWGWFPAYVDTAFVGMVE